MTSFQTAKSKWETAKPLAFAFAIGLVTGPLATNYLGWQVTSRTALAEMHAGIVEQQALFCEARAGGCNGTREARLGGALRAGAEMGDHARRHRVLIGRGERLCEQARGVSAARSGAVVESLAGRRPNDLQAP